MRDKSLFNTTTREKRIDALTSCTILLCPRRYMNRTNRYAHSKAVKPNLDSGMHAVSRKLRTVNSLIDVAEKNRNPYVQNYAREEKAPVAKTKSVLQKIYHVHQCQKKASGHFPVAQLGGLVSKTMVYA